VQTKTTLSRDVQTESPAITVAREEDTGRGGGREEFRCLGIELIK